LCKFRYQLTVHDFGVFDPEYSLKKRGLALGDGEKNWGVIADDCRYLMEYGAGLRMHNISFREKMAFEIACVKGLDKADF
jgi:hypothetical protein